MLDVACDTKSAQLEGGRGTLVGVDANRLVRWDARVGGDARSVVQETTFERGASASPLRYVSGHDFARGAKFRCVLWTMDTSLTPHCSVSTLFDRVVTFQLTYACAC